MSLRRLRCVLPVSTVVLVAVALGGCLAPRSYKQVLRPREGRPMNDKVCIVYSKHYQINLGGIEKLHPFDINHSIENIIRRHGLRTPDPPYSRRHPSAKEKGYTK